MLRKEEVAHFQEEGYVVFESLIAGERLKYYKGVFDELVARASELREEKPHWMLEFDASGKPIPGRLHKIQGVCIVEPRVLELASEPAIVNRVEALLGPNLDVFGTKFFPKLPDGGTSTHWHQDSYYFGTAIDRILSCAIHLEESDKENGCLCVVPGSHHAGVIHEHIRDSKTHGSRTQVDDAQALDLETPAGTVVLFSANLVHGAHDNTSSRSRYSTAWHYLPTDLEMERFPRSEYADRHTVLGLGACSPQGERQEGPPGSTP